MFRMEMVYEHIYLHCVRDNFHFEFRKLIDEKWYIIYINILCILHAIGLDTIIDNVFESINVDETVILHNTSSIKWDRYSFTFVCSLLFRN